MTTPVKWGSEFLVNSTTDGYQSAPDVVALDNGLFVAAWQDTSASGGDTGGTAVRAQLFNADGSKNGTEFLINSTTQYDQFDVHLTSLSEGRFVATWADLSQSSDDASGYAVRAQVFSAEGSRLGSEFLVNTATLSTQYRPTITTLTDGRFIAAWQNGSAERETSARAQIFNADGSRSGTEFLISAPSWADRNPDTGGGVVTIGAGQYSPSLAALSNGGFVAIWEGGFIRAQIFDANGNKSGDAFSVNASSGYQSTAITSLAQGGFVVAWTSTIPSAADPSSYAVNGQIFDANGTKVGTEFLLNTTTVEAQYAPTLTALADGRFVAAWNDTSATGGDASGMAVRAQVFNADGSKSGAEFLLNSTASDNQGNPTLTALADGRFVAAWTDASQLPNDNSGSAVRAQIFDPRTEATLWANATASVDIVGTRWADTISLDSGQNTVHTGAGNDTVYGAAGDDWIQGGIGNDLIAGNDGNDTLMGGGGSDTMGGGAGNDTMTAFGVNTVMFGDAGNDVMRGNGYMSGGEGNDNMTGSGASRMFGDAGDDVLRGGEYLDGGEGNDTLIGGSNTQQMQGGEGNDVIQGSGYAAGGNGNDTYYIGSQGLYIVEDDSANSGIDTVVSGGNVSFSFSSGQAMLDGVLTDAFREDLPGFHNVENLRLIGSASVDAWGSAINNRITGNSGDNDLRGFGGHDTLIGGAGQDTLFGGEGKDRLTGGADADVFAFHMPQEIGNGANRDVITDFTVGVDKIDFTNIDADPTTYGYQSLNFIGTAAFSQTVGELRYNAASGILIGDTNGDGLGDFQLQLIGQPAITSGDLLL